MIWWKVLNEFANEMEDLCNWSNLNLISAMNIAKLNEYDGRFIIKWIPALGIKMEQNKNSEWIKNTKNND